MDKDKEKDLSDKFKPAYNGFEFIKVALRENVSLTDMRIYAKTRFIYRAGVRIKDRVVLFDINQRVARGYFIGKDKFNDCDDRYVQLSESSIFAKELLGKKQGCIVCDKYMIIQILSH